MKLAYPSTRPRLGSSRLRRWLRRFNEPLFAVVVLLLAIGCINQYSVGTDGFVAHCARVLFGLAGFALLSTIDYRALYRPAWAILVAVVVALLCVRLFGVAVNGSQRWIVVGGVPLQPSEFAKVAVILVVSKILQDPAVRGWKLVGSVSGLLIPILLVVRQPDLGTATMIALIAVTMWVLLVDRPWLVMVPGLGVIAVALRFQGPLKRLLWDSLQPYQRVRLTSFLSPTADPSGAGWQTQQSISAVGSGQLTGKGYLNATQSRFEFLPEHATDFPFSVFAEEWGFVGAVILLGLYGFLLGWILRVALQAKDTFGQAICLGIAAMVFWQLVVNLLMVLGFAPVVGVTLPLFSYGGSSMVSVLLGLGMVSSVAQRSHVKTH